MENETHLYFSVLKNKPNKLIATTQKDPGTCVHLYKIYSPLDNKQFIHSQLCSDNYTKQKYEHTTLLFFL